MGQAGGYSPGLGRLGWGWRPGYFSLPLSLPLGVGHEALSLCTSLTHLLLFRTFMGWEPCLSLLSLVLEEASDDYY